jgi:hypothetical protein
METMFAMFSIHQPHLDAADYTRILDVNIDISNRLGEGRIEKFIELERVSEEFTEQHCMSFFKRQILSAQTILQEIKAMERFIRKEISQSRIAEQMAPILVGAASLQTLDGGQMGVIARRLSKEIDWQRLTEKAVISDAENYLEVLTNDTIRLPNGYCPTIYEVLHSPSEIGMNAIDAARILRSIGLKRDGELLLIGTGKNLRPAIVAAKMSYSATALCEMLRQHKDFVPKTPTTRFGIGKATHTIGIRFFQKAEKQEGDNILSFPVKSTYQNNGEDDEFGEL